MSSKETIKNSLHNHFFQVRGEWPFVSTDLNFLQKRMLRANKLKDYALYFENFLRKGSGPSQSDFNQGCF